MMIVGNLKVMEGGIGLVSELREVEVAVKVEVGMSIELGIGIEAKVQVQAQAQEVNLIGIRKNAIIAIWTDPESRIRN